MNVIAHPTRANTIRAYAAQNPALTPSEIALSLRERVAGLKAPEVRKALGAGDKRRIKSVAK